MSNNNNNIIDNNNTKNNIINNNIKNGITDNSIGSKNLNSYMGALNKVKENDDFQKNTLGQIVDENLIYKSIRTHKILKAFKVASIAAVVCVMVIGVMITAMKLSPKFNNDSRINAQPKIGADASENAATYSPYETESPESPFPGAGNGIGGNNTDEGNTDGKIIWNINGNTPDGNIINGNINDGNLHNTGTPDNNSISGSISGGPTPYDPSPNTPAPYAPSLDTPSPNNPSSTEHPSYLNIRFTWGVGLLNVLDTYNNIMTKDLVVNGTASCEFFISQEDLQNIYDKINELKIYDLPQKIISTPNSAGIVLMSDPNVEFTIKFTINQKDYFVSGDSTTSSIGTDEANRLTEFEQYLENFMINTKEYNSLPDAYGGYM